MFSEIVVVVVVVVVFVFVVVVVKGQYKPLSRLMG